MNYGKKRAIIIAIIIIILVITLGLTGMFLYINTDLFKSNQTLFVKYLGQAFEDIKFLENKQLSDIENLKKEMSYTVNSSLKYQSGETNTNLNENILSKMSLNIESKVNTLEEKTYSKAILSHNDQDLFTLEYANSNNIYALKSDEIVTAFLGIENDNLKVLAQKLGITDTTIIPNIIEKSDLEEIFSISQEEKEHIKETYLPVLIKSINKENFTKENNVVVQKEGMTYNATGYRLKLDSEDIKQIEISILQTLKEDSITLNLITTKAKLLGLDEKYTQINNLTYEIQNQIDTINNSNDMQNEGISIIIYVENEEVITTEIIIRNEIKYTIYKTTEENKIKHHLLIENLTAEATYNKIEIELSESINEEQSTYAGVIKLDDILAINVYLDNNGTASNENLTTVCYINISKDGTTSIIAYQRGISFNEQVNDIIELDRNNCGVLNDYTTEQLQGLIQGVYQRILTIINEKKQIIGWVENIEMNDPELQEIEEENM